MSSAVLVTGKTCAVCALKCTWKHAADQEQCVYRWGFWGWGERAYLLTFPNLHRYLLSFSDKPVFASARVSELLAEELESFKLTPEMVNLSSVVEGQILIGNVVEYDTCISDSYFLALL